MKQRKATTLTIMTLRGSTSMPMPTLPPPGRENQNAWTSEYPEPDREGSSESARTIETKVKRTTGRPFARAEPPRMASGTRDPTAGSAQQSHGTMLESSGISRSPATGE
jgi:hypothetical protein